MHAEALNGHLGAKLAFTRLSFPYYTSEAAFAYVLSAVHLVADEGWKLLAQYRFDPDSGLWEHRAGTRGPATGLAELLDAPARPFARAPESDLASQLDAAREILGATEADGLAGPLDEPSPGPEFERICWFPLPTAKFLSPA